MDQCVSDAVAAVPIGVDTAGLWYGALCASYDLCSTEWDELTDELRSQAASTGFGSEIAEGFLEYLGTQTGDPLDTVRAMCLLGADQLTALHEQLYAQATAAGEPYDVEAWMRFLPEYGAAWNGDEASWPVFTEWFHYEAGQAGLGTPAYEFVSYVDSQPDRAAAFAEYGITVGTVVEETGDHTAEEPLPDVSSYPELRDGDSGEWVEYLDQMLASHGF